MNLEKRFLQDLHLFGDESTGMGAAYCTPDKKEIMLPCTCSCSVLSVSKWSDDEDYYFQFYNSYNLSSSFWTRLKEAWRVLRGHYNKGVGIVVSEEDFKKLLQNEKD